MAGKLLSITLRDGEGFFIAREVNIGDGAEVDFLIQNSFDVGRSKLIFREKSRAVARTDVPILRYLWVRVYAKCAPRETVPVIPSASESGTDWKAAAGIELVAMGIVRARCTGDWFLLRRSDDVVFICTLLHLQHIRIA
jgi:hypothetical protein